MGVSLGVTKLAIRGTMFMQFRHLTPHLPRLSFTKSKGLSAPEAGAGAGFELCEPAGGGRGGLDALRLRALPAGEGPGGLDLRGLFHAGASHGVARQS